MTLANYEVSVAYSMVALVGQSSGLAFQPLQAFMCYWTAFNNIYVTVAEQGDRKRVRLKRLEDGTLKTNLVANVRVPVVKTISEKKQINLAFDEFSVDLNHRLIDHPSTRFFVYRTPSWRNRRIEFDTLGQRLNGVINVGHTIDADHPVWSPIDTQQYESYTRGNRNEEIRNALAKQILDLLYTVRNNTFHGGKRADDANDHEVVEQALPLLVMVVNFFLYSSSAA